MKTPLGISGARPRTRSISNNEHTSAIAPRSDPGGRRLGDVAGADPPPPPPPPGPGPRHPRPPQPGGHPPPPQEGGGEPQPPGLPGPDPRPRPPAGPPSGGGRGG